MAKSDTMETETGVWYGETVLERLDRCRKFLFGQGILTATVNDTVRKSLEEYRDLELQAEQDDLAPSVFAAFDEEEGEPDDE
ncbi:MAG: hypothetical protein KAJ42_10605 [Gemmatimonadetes bacterium]|nr:hypothetical protein [Gemmatimonadota bacterium]